MKQSIHRQFFTVISGLTLCAFAFCGVVLGDVTMLGAFSAPQKNEFLKSEEGLLRSVAATENRYGPTSSQVGQSLGDLSAFYRTNGRSDENSIIRERMLDIFVANNPNWRPPLPGGPLLRIGYPGDKSESLKPKSILSHWLNRKSLPKFYAKDQITFENYKKECESKREAAEKSGQEIAVANSLLMLANLYCAQASFSRALPLYEKSLTVRDGAKAHGLQAYRDLLENLDALALVYRIEGRNHDATKIEQRARDRRAPDW